MERARLKPLPLNQYKVSTPTLGGFSLLQSVQNVCFFKIYFIAAKSSFSCVAPCRDATALPVA